MAELTNNTLGLPIIDRIRIAQETLGISRRELMQEITRLANENDLSGMQSLYKAYEDWQLREKKAGVSTEQAEEIAGENLDAAAMLADGWLISHNETKALIYADNAANKPPGRITSFFRKATGYTPLIE